MSLPKLLELKGEKNLAEWNSLLMLHLAYHGLDSYIKESVDANDAAKQRNRIKVMIFLQSSLSSEIRERLINGGINEDEPDPKAFYDGILRLIPAALENAAQELKFTAFYKHLEHLQSLRRRLKEEEDIDAPKDEAQAGSGDEDTTTNRPAPQHKTIPSRKADYAPIRPPSPGLTPEPASNFTSFPGDKNRVEELPGNCEYQEEDIDTTKDGVQAVSNDGDRTEDMIHLHKIDDFIRRGNDNSEPPAPGYCVSLVQAMKLASPHVDIVPKNFRKPRKRDGYYERWLPAMKRQMDQLEGPKTWDLVDRPSGARVLPGTWVINFKVAPQGFG
jgi:hypothetical protein